MTNKPEGVVDHEHFWVYDWKAIDADERLDIVRYDACDLGPKRPPGVWDVEKDIWTPCLDYETAKAVARSLVIAKRKQLGLEV